MIVHRGGRAYGPENTLESAALAAEYGADCIEMDVRKTKDGQLVIMHDPTVERTTDGVGAVADMTLEQFLKLDAGIRYSEKARGVRPPSLEQLLLFGKARGLRISLDMKESGMSRDLRRTLDDVRFPDSQLDIQLWSLDELPLYRGLFPKATMLVIAGGKPTEWGASLAQFHAQGLDGMLYWGSGFSREEIAFSHERGIKVQCVSGDASTVLAQVENGIDGFMTDYPAECVEEFRKVSWRNWTKQYGLAGAAAEPEADPDGDLEENLTEYALGTDPTRAGGSAVSQVSSSLPNELLFAFPRRRLAFNHVMAVPEISEDLRQWGPCPRSQVIEREDGLRVRVSCEGSRAFLRFRLRFRR